jgi:hypothetical protein
VANAVFEDLAALETALTQAVRRWQDNPRALSQLTFYPWWQTGLQTITTS